MMSFFDEMTRNHDSQASLECALAFATEKAWHSYANIKCNEVLNHQPYTDHDLLEPSAFKNTLLT